MKKSRTLASESFQIKEKGFHKLCGDHVISFTNEAYQSQYYYCNWGLLCQISNKIHEIALGQTSKLKEKGIPTEFSTCIGLYSQIDVIKFVSQVR